MTYIHDEKVNAKYNELNNTMNLTWFDQNDMYSHAKVQKSTCRQKEYKSILVKMTYIHGKIHLYTRGIQM